MGTYKKIHKLIGERFWTSNELASILKQPERGIRTALTRMYKANKLDLRMKDGEKSYKKKDPGVLSNSQQKRLIHTCPICNLSNTDSERIKQHRKIHAV